MNCSIRHNVREALVTEGLAVLENTDLRPVVSETELVARSYTMAQELLEEYGVNDIPYVVSDDRIVLNEELFRQLDGADPEIQQELEDELLASMRNVMNKLGLSATMVDRLRDREGNPIQGVAAADLLNRSIQYLEGKESELPEEVIHFYVQALKDTSDPLYSSMRDRITSEPEYAQVKEEYSELGYSEDDLIDEAITKVVLNRVRKETAIKSGVQELFDSNPELANKVYEALGFNKLRKEYGNLIIDQVWGRLAKEGITNADNLIGTRDTINNVDFVKFWSNVKNEDINASITFFQIQKQKALDSYSKYKGEFDPTTGMFTSDDTSFYDNKIKDLQNLLEQKQQALQLYSQYLDTIFPDSKVADQTHILGSKQDVEGFKKFVSQGAVSGESQDRNTRWWNRVLRRLKEMFNVGTESTDPFKQAALDMFRKDMTQYREVVSQFTRGQIMRSVGDTQSLIRESIVTQHAGLEQQDIRWEELVGKVDNLLIEQAKEGDGIIVRYKNEKGKIISKRATDKHQIEFLRTLVKKGGKRGSKSYERIRLAGTDLHEVARWMAFKYAKKHTDRFNLPELSSDKEPTVAELMELSGLDQNQLKTFAKEVTGILDQAYKTQQAIDPKGKVDVMPEVRVYDRTKDTAGTIDLLLLFSDGTASVYDYKFISPAPEGNLKEGSYQLNKEQFQNYKLSGYDEQMTFYTDALRNMYGVQRIRKSRLVPGHVRFNYDDGNLTTVSYFGMGIGTDRYLAQIPVANEVSDSAQMNIRLSKIYNRLKEINSIKNPNAAVKRERETLQKAVKELLNDSDMRWTMADMDSALDRLKNEDREEMSLQQIATDLMLLGRYKMLNEAMSLKNMDDDAKSALFRLTQEVESAREQLLNMYMARVKQERGYDLTSISQGSSGWDSFISLHTHHNEIVAYGMNLVTKAKISAQEELNVRMAEFDTLKNDLEKWGSVNGKNLQEVYEMLMEDTPHGLRMVSVLSEDFKKVRKEMYDLLLSDKEGDRRVAMKWARENFQRKENAEELYKKDLERFKTFLNTATAGEKSKRYDEMLNQWKRDHDIWDKDNLTAWLGKGKRYLELNPESFERNVSDRYRVIMNTPELMAWTKLWKDTLLMLDRRMPHAHISQSMVPVLPVTMGEVMGTRPSNAGKVLKDQFTRNFTVETELDERFGSNVKSIPLRFMRPLRNSNGVVDTSMYSRDLRDAMYQFMQSALENEKLTEIEGQMLLLREILPDTMVGLMKDGRLSRAAEDRKLVSEADPETVKIFQALINSELYGEKWKEDSTMTVFGVKMSKGKSVQSLMSLWSRIRMTLPIKAAISAGVAGESFMRAQMNSNPNFGEGNYIRSVEMALRDNERFAALAHRFDALSEPQSRIVARGERSTMAARIMDPVYGYAPLITMDRMLNAMTMVTMLHSYGIKDGDAIRLSELPEGTKSIAESMEVKDGKITTEIPQEILTKMIMMHRMEMLGITGSASMYDFAAYHNDMMSSVLMQFKSWMPGLVQGKFGETRFDRNMDRFTEGRYKGAFRAMNSAFDRENIEGEYSLRVLLKKTADTGLHALHALVRDSAYTLSSEERAKRITAGTWDKVADEKKFQDRRNRMLAEYEVFRNNTNIPRFKKPGPPTDADIEEFMRMRQQSVRGMMTEVRNVLGLLLMSSVLTAALEGDDDEPMTYAESLTDRIMARIIMEMAQFMNPVELAKVLKQPVALLGLFELLARITTNGVDNMVDLIQYGAAGEPGDKTGWFHYTPQLIRGYNTFKFFTEDLPELD